jgi:urea carboxylase
MATFLPPTGNFNSSRTGVRLIGPKPVWARDSGGEAGLHPSNIHDNPYAVGAVDFTGDMPVILGPDGPSLGGFVCPVTVIEADLWQLGQLKAGDKVRFVAVDVPTARRLAAGRRAELATLQAQDVAWQPVPLTSPVVMTCGDADKRLVARLSGDTHLLLEAGEAELDLVLRFRIHALMQALEGKPGKGSSISRRGSARCSCISSRKRWRWRPCWRGSAGSGPRSA